MPIVQLTTQEQVDQNIANLESRLNQTTPAADKAYNRVIATMEAQGQTALAKYAADRILAVLAQTAKGADLDLLGGEYDTLRHQATAAVLSVTLTGTNATVIPVGTIMVGLPNSALYTVTTGGTIALGTVTLALTAQAAGSSGNLNNADTLTLQSAIAGASGIPTVASTTTTGADVETDDAYRPRVLDAQRAQATGIERRKLPPVGARGIGCRSRIPLLRGADGRDAFGASHAHRVRRMRHEHPGGRHRPRGPHHAGTYGDHHRPEHGPCPSGPRTHRWHALRPGDHAHGDLRADHGPQRSLGPDCGLPDGNRGGAHHVPFAVTPFVTGVDPTFGRNDSITNLSISKVVQAVLIAYGAAASNIGFGLTAITFSSTYTVGQGEKTKLGAVSYV